MEFYRMLTGMEFYLMLAGLCLVLTSVRDDSRVLRAAAGICLIVAGC